MNTAGTFRYPSTEAVVYGRGAFEGLPALVEQLGGRRVFAIISASLERGGLGARLEQLLGARLAAVRAGVPQHVPNDAVLAIAQEARAARADVLLSVGGGTAIDCAKAVGLCLAKDLDTREALASFRVRFTYPATVVVPDVDGPLLPHIAVPTTLSGAEHTNLFGVTDTAERAKHVYAANAFCPTTVVLDPNLTVETPPWLWAASGMRAVDHAVEGMLSPRRSAFMEALGSAALATLVDTLASSTERPEDHEGRLRCLTAAWTAVYALPNAGSGLSHAIGHQLAAEFDIVHGITSAIMLPRVLAFNAQVAAADYRALAAPLGLDVAALDDQAAAAAVVTAVERFVGSLAPFGVPSRLSDAGAQRERLAAVADRTLEDIASAVNPRPIKGGDLHALLESAW